VLFRSYHAARLVRRELEAQGWTAGWRPIHAALAGRETRYEVERSVRAWKARHRQHVARVRAAHRVHVEVLAPDVIWTQDVTQVGRVGRTRLQAEVVKDRATLGTVALAVGPATTGEEVVNQLEGVRDTRGLPLVLAMDNGPAYRSAVLEDWLAREQVVVLRSQPHVPQDNGAAERGIGELKAEAELDARTVLHDPGEAAARLAAARARLDGHRVRVRLGGTAVELGGLLPRCYDAVDRTTFYRCACEAMERAAAGRPGLRARRRAERDALYAVLEEFGMVRRTRGGMRIPLVKPEGLS
jgi:transposase InsO family protein